MNEFDWIEWINKKAGPAPKGWIGIGDDAAVIPGLLKKDIVISTDAIVEGVDFDQFVRPEQAGRKALAINLSDIAAMGARPEAFLMTLGVPPSWKKNKLQRFICGVFQLAKEYRVHCIGGDMSSAQQFFCSITILGSAPQKGVILREGAKPGDLILVTGDLGGSIRKKHYAFTPRVKEGMWLAQNVMPSALMDVSDGLAQDLMHILKASRCAARLELNQVPMSKDAINIHSALSDGEDFELLMTMSRRNYAGLLRKWNRAFPHVSLTSIGVMMKGSPQIEYCFEGIAQKNFKVGPGFQHFS